MISIHSAKRSGHDGFNREFFKQSWGVVGEEVSDVVLDFLQSGQMLKEVHKTVLVLLPKKVEP